MIDNVSLRNCPSSQHFDEEPMIMFSIVKNDQMSPNEMIDYSGGRFWNFIQGLKEVSFI